VKKEKSKVIEVNPQGSLGILALGHVCLKIWREAIEKDQKESKEKKK